MPKFGRRQVEEITRLEITRLIDKVQLSSGPHAANAVMWLIKRIFNWHAERSNFKSPLRTKTKPRGEPSIRKRKLLDHEIKAIWEAAGDSPTLFSRMVQLLLLTACRRDEVADMRRSEIEGTCWTIPSSRYKTKIDVEIPLSPAAMKVLDASEPIGPALALCQATVRVPEGDRKWKNLLTLCKFSVPCPAIRCRCA
jgi:integrase